MSRHEPYIILDKELGSFVITTCAKSVLLSCLMTVTLNSPMRFIRLGLYNLVFISSRKVA